MNFFTKTKFLVGVIIVLSAVILAIFGTFGYHFLASEKRSNDEPKENSQPGNFMAKKLNLTPSQIVEFDSLRHKFHRDIDTVEGEINTISNSIIEEITLDKPDSKRLDSLSIRFGQLQTRQKQMIINHLLEVKGRCTSQQQVCFTKLLRQMEKRDRMKNEKHRDRLRSKENQNKN